MSKISEIAFCNIGFSKNCRNLHFRIVVFVSWAKHQTSLEMAKVNWTKITRVIGPLWLIWYQSIFFRGKELIGKVFFLSRK